MPRTVKHNPNDPAEVAAVQIPGGEPDSGKLAELIDPEDLPQATPVGEPGPDDESSDEVIPDARFPGIRPDGSIGLTSHRGGSAEDVIPE